MIFAEAKKFLTGDDNAKKARTDGMRPLSNIFEGTELGKMMEAQKALIKK